MNNRFWPLKNRLSSNSLFIRYFIQIFLVMAVIFSLFTMYTFHNTRQLFESEFTNDTLQDAQNLSDSMEDYILETEYMISTLINNNTLHTFFSYTPEDFDWRSYLEQAQTLLQALQNSKQAIETIYLYSGFSQTILSSSIHEPVSSFEDSYWLDELKITRSGFHVFPYAMRNNFPYVLCVAKEFTVNQNRCAIAVMIDLSMLSTLISFSESSDNSAFLISDDNKIIYRYRQEELEESLDTVNPLLSYQPDTKERVAINNDGTGTYALAQLHSESFPWSYVIVTFLPNYSSSLSSQNALLFTLLIAFLMSAILIAIFLTIRSLKPIQNIRIYLDSPEMMSINQISDSEDIKYIAGRINQYIQTNHALKDELQKRLMALNETQILALQLQINPHFLSNTLNLMYVTATKALGYDHALPQMILNTSSMIRYALEPSRMVSFDTELSQTNIYLEILEQRYDQNLKIVHDIAADTLDAMVPRLFIQPIIENAVFHGFSRRQDSECILTIRSFLDLRTNQPADKFVVIQIRDNGNGIDKERLEELKASLYQEKSTSGKGIGLRNVVQRMNLIYSDKFSLTIESLPGEGTCFSLTFPYVSSAGAPELTVRP